MKARATVVSVMVASFYIAVPGTAASDPHNFLKAGGVDDADVADAYYNTIDPDGLRETQDEWREVNGFKDSRNKVVVAAGYFNEGDLAFFRRIEMVVDQRPGKKGNIAFTTVNYDKEDDANRDVKRVSIVNMEYSPGPDGVRMTKFYVFDPEGNRRISTAFDSRGEELFLPAACFSCHGGDDVAVSSSSVLGGYNAGSGETNGTFLAFDINTMTFGNPPQADLEKAFKQFNQAVLRTNPTAATRTLINGLYGGSGLPLSEQDLGYIPPDWQGDLELEELYSEVFVPSCRSCHTTSDTKLNGLDYWKTNPAKIREIVFHEQTMPNSLPSFNRFWDSAGTLIDQPAILDAALTRFETAP